MNPFLDPSLNANRAATYAVFLVLSKWYAAHSSIRRLWAFKEPQRMRVIVMLEPTLDSDDMYPAWLANGHEWAHDLQSRLDGPVELELMSEPPLAQVSAGVGACLVAELFWRDSRVPP